VSDARTALIVPMHDSLRQLERCVEALSWAPGAGLSVVVVDAGSSDGSADWLAVNAPDFVLITGDAAMWWTESVELGCRSAIRDLGATRLALLNVDCTWSAAGYAAAIEAAERHPGVIVCSHVCDGRSRATVFAGGIVLRSGMLTVRGAGWAAEAAPSSGWVDWCGGQGVVFDACDYLAADGFDYRAFPHYYGDSDFCLRAARGGTRVWFCRDSIVSVDERTTGLSPLAAGGSAAIWRTLTSRRSVYNVRDTVRFYARHAGRRAPLAIAHQYGLWAAWSARGLVRRRFGV
jgi:GT2 family glycosyltransferase